MRTALTLSALVAALALVSGCDKPAQPSTENPAAAQPAVKEAKPFVRSGEWLSVNVDKMPRQELFARLGELTGARITAEGDGNLPVSVRVENASLRQVLGLALADAPYTVSMEFANLQDSFPATVVVKRYAGVATAPAAAPVTGIAPQQVPEENTAGFAPEDVVIEPEEDETAIDFAALPPEEGVNRFLNLSEGDQISVVFDFEPTPEQSALMTNLVGRSELSQDVKFEILDSLSNGEYDTSIPALKVALEDKDTEVVAKAVGVIGELGSARDIATLKAVAEKHEDEEVRQSVTDAIEFLQ